MLYMIKREIVDLVGREQSTHSKELASEYF
jgi:hypothetical protein